MLMREAQALRRDWPEFAVVPVEADFMQPFALPAEAASLPHTGFYRANHRQFRAARGELVLRHAGHMLGKGATLIIGVDLIKDASTLNAAYNDAAGITARFNLNLLTRINHELNGSFDLSTFSHHAFYNSERHRIEMHLASKKRQKVRVAGR